MEAPRPTPRSSRFDKWKEDPFPTWFCEDGGLRLLISWRDRSKGDIAGLNHGGL